VSGQGAAQSAVPHPAPVAHRVPRDAVDGVLLLDKPTGMTSNGALQTAKRLLNAAKAGHTGTLDPLASGLLPLCFGEATKFAGELLTADKRYRAAVRLGIKTTTGDAEGEVIASRPVAVSRGDFESALAAFRGVIQQLPPRYSALKYQGRPQYEYARAGIDVPREIRTVAVHELEIEAWNAPECTLVVRCSKGTYVRSLAEDIGEALGCGAHLAALRRIAIGRYTLAQAVTLDELGEMTVQSRRETLLPAAALVEHLPAVRLSAQSAACVCQGQTVELAQVELSGPCRLLDARERFLGLGEARAGRLYPKRMLAAAKGLVVSDPG
jgi:tRNA pseudouridine55 synthase